MNHSVYIFGDFGSGYSQYPDDFAKSILSKDVDDIKANSQIALHREGNLIYYSYYRKFLGGVSPRGFIGFSICFNGVYCTDTIALFSLFERGVTDLAVSGRLIEFSTDGDVLPKAGALYLQKEEIDRIAASLSSEIERIASTSFKNLPPYNYGAGINEEKHCSVTDAEKELQKLIKLTNNIVIHKDSNYKSAQFVGFAKQLSDLFSTNQELNKQNDNLNKQVASLNKQKKQYKLVTALSILFLLAIIGIIAFGHNILTLRGEVENKESIIVEKNGGSLKNYLGLQIKNSRLVLNIPAKEFQVIGKVGCVEIAAQPARKSRAGRYYYFHSENYALQKRKDYISLLFGNMIYSEEMEKQALL